MQQTKRLTAACHLFETNKQGLCACTCMDLCCTEMICEMDATDNYLLTYDDKNGSPGPVSICYLRKRKFSQEAFKPTVA